MKTRTIKELLQVMLDNQHLFYEGLCRLSVSLTSKGLISFHEKDMLLTYIKANRPKLRACIRYIFCTEFNYYWTPGDITPRIKWLNKHIKLNS